MGPFQLAHFARRSLLCPLCFYRYDCCVRLLELGPLPLACGMRPGMMWLGDERSISRDRAVRRQLQHILCLSYVHICASFFELPGRRSSYAHVASLGHLSKRPKSAPKCKKAYNVFYS